MHKSTTVVLVSIAIGIASIILSCHLSEVQSSSYFAGIIMKLLIRDIYPALDNQAAGLAKVRSLINGQPSVPYKNQTVINLSILTSADQPMQLRLYLHSTAEPHQNSIGNAQPPPLRPVLIWFHGGGFVIGNYTNEDNQCSKIVGYTDFIVVNVDYRLAPENKFPAGVNDGFDALQWTRDSIEEYGGDPSQIYISGESAGGTIATAVTALNLDPARTDQSRKVNIKGIFILYPCLEHGVYRDSHFRYSDSFALLTLKQMQYFWSLYLPDQGKDCADYRACPLRTPDSILERFPQALVVLAKHDILLDEGLAFAERLTSSNVPLKTMVFNDVYHGFFAKGLSGEDQTIEICAALQSMIQQ